MNNIPLTYCLSLAQQTDAVRRSMLREFTICGGRNLTLTDSTISRIVREPAFAGILKKEMQEFGFTFVDSHAPFGTLFDPNEPGDLILRAAYHKMHLAICEMMNVDTMCLHIGNDHQAPGDSTAVQLDRICRVLAELLPEAEKRNIVICIENIILPINTPENLWKIKQKFDSPYLGFCYDSGHANVMDKGRFSQWSTAHDYWDKIKVGTPAWDDKILEKMLPETVTCHLHDNTGGMDSHALPGAGNIDWQHIKSLLRRAPRLRSLQCEVIRERRGTSIREMVETFEKLFNSED